MAIFGLDLSTTREYVSKYDVGDSPTRWRIRPLDSRVYGHIRDRALQLQFHRAEPGQPRSDERTSGDVKRYEVSFLALAFGLDGWEGFTGRDGSEIEPKKTRRRLGNQDYEVIADEVLRLIPGVVVDELADEIMSANELDAEAGNA